mmetsp:Transcript_37535/g.81713  ORF Transcript_37535/g.81713 Transcript_37535/m.81713 type:complete len:200 (+) Transcript_37535:618-1217(+)
MQSRMASWSMNGWRRFTSKIFLPFAALYTALIVSLDTGSRCARLPKITAGAAAALASSAGSGLMASQADGCTMSYDGMLPFMVTFTKPVDSSESTCRKLVSTPLVSRRRRISSPRVSSPTHDTQAVGTPSPVMCCATFTGAPPRKRPAGKPSQRTSPMQMTGSASFAASARTRATPRLVLDLLSLCVLAEVKLFDKRLR